MEQIKITYDKNHEQPVVSSLQVAEDFNKQHKDVLKAIESIKAQNCAVTNMFYESTYQAGTGKSYKMYLMNRDGFSLLVMGFTGKDALEWKLKYIKAFNVMEQKLKDESIQMDGLSTEMKALIMHDKKIVEQDARLDALEDSTKLSSCERKKIKKAIHSAVANACGGKKTMAYAEHSKKVYSALYGFLYDYYDVSEYADIPKIKYTEALELISDWYPDYELKQKINASNYSDKMDV